MIKKTEAPQPAASEPESTLPPQEVQKLSPEVVDFYQRYSLALEAWMLAHGTRVPPPVYVDPIDGKMKWANREMRKRHTKARMKSQKKKI